METFTFSIPQNQSKILLKSIPWDFDEVLPLSPKGAQKNDLENNIHSESYAISVSVRSFTIFAHACLWVPSLLHLSWNLCQDLLVSSQSFREVKVSEMKQCGRSLALRSALVLAQVTGYLCPTDMFCLANTAWTQYSFVQYTANTV